VEHSQRASALLDRLIYLSDGVFAIAMTLLAIELMLPAVSSADPSEMARALASLWPKYLSFLISFVVIASYWMSHQRIFTYIVRTDTRLVWLNMLLLLLIAFQPFPTSVLGSYSNTPAVTFYAGTLLVTGVIVLAMWVYATTNHRLVVHSLSARMIRQTTVRAAAAPVVFLVSIFIAQANANLAEYFWLTIAVIFGVLRWAFRDGG
jgi:uncharacterized membrane protein